MNLGFGNNIRSALAADISASQTQIPVMPGTGVLFARTLEQDPALSNPSYSRTLYAKVTLSDAQATTFEICHLLSVSGDMLTVIRGQEGTKAKGWSLEDVISNFATRGSENNFVQIEDLQGGTFLSAVAGGTENDLTATLPSTFFINGGNTFSLRAPLLVFPSLTNTGPATLRLTVSGRVVGTYPVVKGSETPLVAGDITRDIPVQLVFSPEQQTFVLLNPVNGVFSRDDFVKKSGDTMSGTLTVEKEIRQTSQDSYRSVYGQYGTFWRSDDSNFYLLITQAGDPWGTSGHLRPFTLSLPTGKVTLGNNAAVNGTLDVSSRVLPGDYSNFDARYLQQSVDLPVGIPLPWASVVAPSGWLLCNGAGFDRSVFPRLAAAYPNGLLPDLRGVFLRGWDNGRGLDPGRALGDLQTGQAPASAIGRGEWGNYAGRSTGITALIGTDNDGRPTVMQETEQQRETRPVNVSFNYIVRAA